MSIGLGVAAGVALKKVIYKKPENKVLELIKNRPLFDVNSQDAKESKAHFDNLNKLGEATNQVDTIDTGSVRSILHKLFFDDHDRCRARYAVTSDFPLTFIEHDSSCAEAEEHAHNLRASVGKDSISNLGVFETSSCEKNTKICVKSLFFRSAALSTGDAAKILAEAQYRVKHSNTGNDKANASVLSAIAHSR